jgi:hypothetical protein
MKCVGCFVDAKLWKKWKSTCLSQELANPNSPIRSKQHKNPPLFSPPSSAPQNNYLLRRNGSTKLHVGQKGHYCAAEGKVAAPQNYFSSFTIGSLRSLPRRQPKYLCAA